MPWRSGAGQLPVRPRPTLLKCMFLLSLIVGVAVAVAVAIAWLYAGAGFDICNAATAAEADTGCNADAADQADAGCHADAAVACSCTKFWSLGL